MKNYKSYMDRQELPPALHETLMNLKPPKRTVRPWAKYGALAACAVLIAGVGMRLSREPGTIAEQILSFQSDESQPRAQDAISAPGPGSQAANKDVADPGVKNAGDTNSRGAADFHGFVADSGQALDKMMFPMIPSIAYPDTTGSPQIAASIALPDGSFSVDLSQRDIELMLWGSEEAMEQAHAKEKPGNVPWLLFWDGFTLSGGAIYDGQGQLWQAYLRGDREDERFEIIMAPGKLPPTCIAQNGCEVTDVRGVKVEAWSNYYDFNGDGVKEYRLESAFTAHDIGVRATFISPEDDGFLSSLFINWNTYSDGGLTLDHLMTTTEIPAWREEEFSTLAQARQEADYAPYLPSSSLEGEFYGRLSYQEGVKNTLWVRWSQGYDDVEVCVHRDGYYTYYLADPSRPETYDLRLYPTPWCDSVPPEHRETVDRPAFLAEDMSLAVVEARANEKDTGGLSFRFDVVHPDGTVVSYDCGGLTAQQVWALVEETL